MAGKKMGIDTSGWTRKILHVNAAFTDAVDTATKKGSDVILKETVKNVSGQLHQYGTPSPAPGQLPVSRITSMLKQSITRKQIKSDLAIVYPDVTIAPYAAAVHDGSKDVDNAYIMKRRPYLYQAIADKKDECVKIIKEELMKAIRKYGLS